MEIIKINRKLEKIGNYLTIDIGGSLAKFCYCQIDEICKFNLKFTFHFIYIFLFKSCANEF